MIEPKEDLLTYLGQAKSSLCSTEDISIGTAKAILRPLTRQTLLETESDQTQDIICRFSTLIKASHFKDRDKLTMKIPSLISSYLTLKKVKKVC